MHYEYAAVERIAAYSVAQCRARAYTRIPYINALRCHSGHNGVFEHNALLRAVRCYCKLCRQFGRGCKRRAYTRRLLRTQFPVRISLFRLFFRACRAVSAPYYIFAVFAFRFKPLIRPKLYPLAHYRTRAYVAPGAHDRAFVYHAVAPHLHVFAKYCPAQLSAFPKPNVRQQYAPLYAASFVYPCARTCNAVRAKVCLCANLSIAANIARRCKHSPFGYLCAVLYIYAFPCSPGCCFEYTLPA